MAAPPSSSAILISSSSPHLAESPSPDPSPPPSPTLSRSSSSSAVPLLEEAEQREYEEESAEVRDLTQCMCSNTNKCMQLLLLSVKFPFQFFGGRIYVHWSILLLILYFVWILNPNSANVGTYIILCVGLIAIALLSVFIHELGHVLAYYYIYKTPSKIVALHLLGGFTLPKKILPDQKANIAVVCFMGPLFNFLLAAIFAAPYFASKGEKSTWGSLVFFTCIYNLLLGIFNMLPIFPMDGGKVVRSLALVCMSEKVAVYATSAVSGVCLVGLLAYAIYERDYVTMFMLPVFVLAIYYEIKRVRSLSPPSDSSTSPSPPSPSSSFSVPPSTLPEVLLPMTSTQPSLEIEKN